MKLLLLALLLLCYASESKVLEVESGAASVIEEAPMEEKTCMFHIESLVDSAFSKHEKFGKPQGKYKLSTVSGISGSYDEFIQIEFDTRVWKGVISRVKRSELLCSNRPHFVKQIKYLNSAEFGMLYNDVIGYFLPDFPNVMGHLVPTTLKSRPDTYNADRLLIVEHNEKLIWANPCCLKPQTIGLTLDVLPVSQAHKEFFLDLTDFLAKETYRFMLQSKIPHSQLFQKYPFDSQFHKKYIVDQDFS